MQKHMFSSQCVCSHLEWSCDVESLCLSVGYFSKEKKRFFIKLFNHKITAAHGKSCLLLCVARENDLKLSLYHNLAKSSGSIFWVVGSIFWVVPLNGIHVKNLSVTWIYFCVPL